MCEWSFTQIFPILSALASVTPDYTTVLLPFVARELHVEEDSQRLQVVRCLASLFAVTPVPYLLFPFFQ